MSGEKEHRIRLRVKTKNFHGFRNSGTFTRNNELMDRPLLLTNCLFSQFFLVVCLSLISCDFNSNPIIYVIEVFTPVMSNEGIGQNELD